MSTTRKYKNRKMTFNELKIGETVHNQDIFDIFNGNKFSGIRPHGDHIVLVSKDYNKVYPDQWHDSVLHYIGAGKKNQSINHGPNKSLYSAWKENNKAVYLFITPQPDQYVYLGPVKILKEYPDNNHKYNLIVFCIEPKYHNLNTLHHIQDKISSKLPEKNLVYNVNYYDDNLVKKVNNHDNSDNSTYRSQVSTSKANRNSDVRLLTIKLAHGKCQLCGKHTFKEPNGHYYLESHHIIPLGKQHNGPDIITNTIALCPTCHRMMHYGDKSIIMHRGKISGTISEIQKMLKKRNIELIKNYNHHQKNKIDVNL